jgi:PHP family Zn ribbon phosphoesterase
MADPAVTYAADPPITGKKFVCKRCAREYAFPQARERPIRCECGWWYYNDGVGVREAYWQRIDPYRVPPAIAKMFERS